MPSVSPATESTTRFRDWYERATSPSTSGLPRLRVLFAFPVLLVIAGAILISTGINGTSSGAYYSQVFEGDDPRLLAGEPQSIRSDEWNTLTAWSISQVQQGLPERSESFPGGMDASIPQDLPRSSWDVIFRPHLIGYLFLDVDQATAWRWWIPALSLMAAAYSFIVTVLPRRPVMAALVSTAFFFSPFFQWWFLPGTFWPATWAFATMAGLVWAFARASWGSRWVWASVVAYVTTVMMMGLYVPFIIPAVLVIPFFTVGLFIDRIRRGEHWRGVLLKVMPVLAAAAAAAAVILLWLQAKAETVDAFLNTDYPGERLFPTGMGTVETLVRAVSSSFTDALNRVGGFMGMNSSEASTFFFVGIFLIPVIAWTIWREARARRVLPWALIGLVSVVVLFAAFIFVPGWDAVAHVLFLDRTVDTRLRIGMAIASIALLTYLVRYLDDHAIRAPRTLSWATALLFFASQAAIAFALYRAGGMEQLAGTAPFWWVDAILAAIAIVAFARRRALLGGIAFVTMAAFSSSSVNPVYIGALDLRDSDVSQSIIELDSANGGDWIGIGSPVVTAILLESGVTTRNGVQGAPSDEMWEQIDPDDNYRSQWNRLGLINWVFADGDSPTVTNPSPDQIVVTLNPCSDFAQDYIEYVLTDSRTAPGECLTRVDSFRLPLSTLTIYEISRPR